MVISIIILLFQLIFIAAAALADSFKVLLFIIYRNLNHFEWTIVITEVNSQGVIYEERAYFPSS
jgi:hypothetical protein